MSCKSYSMKFLSLLFLIVFPHITVLADNKKVDVNEQILVKIEMEDVRSRLASSFHKKLLQNTYNSIEERLQPDGYFPESLTGAYAGMYPRTVGAMARFLLQTGELKKAESIIGYCIDAMTENDMDRIPHVVGLRESVRVSMPDANTPACLDTSIAFARIGGNFGAAQTFIAGVKPLKGIEVYITALTPQTRLHIELTDHNNISLLAFDLFAGKPTTSNWIHAAFPKPMQLVPGQVYRIKFTCPDTENSPILFAGKKPAAKTFVAAYQLDTQQEHTHSDKALSIVFDYDEQAYREDHKKIKILSSSDQLDGQAHILVAWGMLAQQRGAVTEFEERTYPIVAKLMDRSTDEPYLCFNTGWRIHPGLACNINLEHSRDTQFWYAYDFLTQSFIASALENMIPIAQRRQDNKHVELWSSRLNALNKSIAANMTRDFEGSRIYLEMLLPTGRKPEPFTGIGWLNLAPVPSGWKGVDPIIFKNTIDAWHRVAVINWKGPRIYACDWLPKGQTDVAGLQQSTFAIGKQIAWDMVYCFRAKEFDRVCEMLDFIEQVNSTAIFAEAFNFDSKTGKWILNDPGNGEQVCWYVWAMTILRHEVGLPVLPSLKK